MVKNLKKIILLVIIFLIGAAIGAGAMLLREKSYWDNEDKKLAEYFNKKQEEINSGIYSLADGNFYLNGDDRNAYWEVKDSTIKLFADEEQLLTYYYASCAAVEQRGASVSGTLSGNTDFTDIPNYENRMNRLRAYTAESAEYIFDVSRNSSDRSGVIICAESLGGEDWEKQYIYGEEGGVFKGGVYINENVFELDGCVWVRLD